MNIIHRILGVSLLGAIGFWGGGAARIIAEFREEPARMEAVPFPAPSLTSTPAPTPPPILFEPQHLPGLLLGAKERLAAEGGVFIEADLGAMKLRLFESGELIREYPILVKGKEGDWGETAAGVFKIRDKEELHFSSLGRVYMPHNMTFQGNYSIHGRPFNPDGSNTSSFFSSGCINLAREDAADLFSRVEVGTPVIVHERDFENDAFEYRAPATLSRLPSLVARGALAADLRNGFVLFERNIDERVPMASLTKLMTALIATEYNLLSFTPEMSSKVRITEAMVEPIGEVRGLEPGATFSYFDLLYPLLLSSSNDAAEALAAHRGRTRFIARMNARAESLGLMDTAFVDPHGYGAENISTPRDLFYLGRYLLTNRKWLLNITRGKLYADFGPLSFARLSGQNLNLFEDRPDFIGGKVGGTPEARETGLFIFSLPVGDAERPIAIIVLGSTDLKRDAEELLHWVRDEFLEGSFAS